MRTKTFSKRALSVLLVFLVVFSVFTVAITTSMQSAQARTGDTVVGTKTFNSTLFDYYYDSEMVDSAIIQGVAQSYTNEAYHMLNNAASDYYEANGTSTPIYFGNFYKQDVDTVFDYSQKPGELYNYTWTANIANRSNPNAVAQGIFADALVDGVPAQNGTNGAVKVPYFDKEWLTTKIGQSAMVVNFTFNYGDKYMTMPYTDGDSTGANTFRLFEVVEPGTNYYFAERGSDCNVLADNLYSGVEDTQIGINFKFESWEGMPDSMKVNLMTPAGNIISVPMNADAPNKSFWLVIDKNDPATSNFYNQLTAEGKAVQMGEVYENLNFPFDVIDNNGVAYYQFTSREYNYDVNNDNKNANGDPAGVTTGQNNIYFNGTDWAVRSEGVRDWNFEELSAADADWAYDNDMGSGFFPMNAADPDASASGAYDYTAKRDLKYGYAVKYDIPFTLSSNGKVLDKDGKEVATTFEFMGDDDLLVYIDGELVLDMGGAHKMAKGKIDFSTGEATVTTGAVLDIAGQEATGDPLNTKHRAGLEPQSVSSNGILKEFLDNNKTYDPTEAHTMTIYYVERGMFNANAFIRFNLPVTTSVEVEKEVDYTALTEEQKESYLDDEFTYNFKLTTINDNDIADYAEAIWENITNVDFDKINGDTYTFTLKAGETAKFDNIPANIGYVISEMDVENYTLSGVYAQNLTETGSQMTKLDKLVANGTTDGRTNMKYKFVNAADEIPTTTVAPTTTAPTTPPVTTTQAPTTTVAPTTTQAPTTTVAPTTQAPTTTAVPTTVAPTTEPTEAPTTTAVPTTAEPTEAPTTTAAPTTAEPTEAPTTTAAPTTAEPTEAPTTAEPTEAPTTTMAAETIVVTTTQAPETLPVPDVPKTGDNVMYVYVAMVALLAGVACIYIKKRTAK
ncbi:MAG: hypothetical protein IJW04_01625 [Ruminococcus sp.]|nr:hypothetical protein [Ruminococcus sp.]